MSSEFHCEVVELTARVASEDSGVRSEVAA